MVMQTFTTNWALYDPLTPKKKNKNFDTDSVFLSEEMQRKIKLITKAFR